MSTAHIPSFPYRLSLYHTVPEGTISIENFENVATKRLQLLKQLEIASLRSPKDTDLLSTYKKYEQSFLPLHSSSSSSPSSSALQQQERFNDNLSHFILLLVYCKSTELQRWFVTYETMLFRMRWLSELPSERNEFLSSLQLPIASLSREEREAVELQLAAARNSRLAGNEIVTAAATNSLDAVYFAVPFVDVLDLVGRRAVFIRNGIAYVPKSEIYSLVVSRFKCQLEERLELAAKALPRLDENDRLMPILGNLHNWEGSVASSAFGQFGNSAAATGALPSISAADIDPASAHFPPCMLKLHQRLRLDGHLKHGGRMQYGLFLKSIGLSMEEALLFWKRAFSQKYSEDAFNRHYAYNIRHNYGMEGRRVNYTPYNCVKIITSNQPSGPYDCHGCPFKHSGVDGLKSFLVNYSGPSGAKLNAEQIEEISELASRQHFQVACSKLFEMTRNTKGSSSLPIEPMIHPHIFYQQSIALGKENGK